MSPSSMTRACGCLEVTFDGPANPDYVTVLNHCKHDAYVWVVKDTNPNAPADDPIADFAGRSFAFDLVCWNDAYFYADKDSARHTLIFRVTQCPEN